jgi:hypothetical protein
VQDLPALLKAVISTDIQRVAKRLFRNPPSVASVVVGEEAPLKPALQGRVQFEVLGEVSAPVPPAKTPAKPASNANPG